MTIRTKFVCTGVTKRHGTVWDNVTNQSKMAFVFDAEFQTVYGTSDENKKFFASTPTGTVKLSTYREDSFEPGKEYYLDFTPA